MKGSIVTSRVSCADFIRTLRPNGPDFVHISSDPDLYPEPCVSIDGYVLSSGEESDWFCDGVGPSPFVKMLYTFPNGVDLYRDIWHPMATAVSRCGWSEGDFQLLVLPEGIWAFDPYEGYDDSASDVSRSQRFFRPAGADIRQDISNLTRSMWQDKTDSGYHISIEESSSIISPGYHPDRQCNQRYAHPSYWEGMNLASPDPITLHDSESLGSWDSAHLDVAEFSPDNQYAVSDLRVWCQLINLDFDYVLSLAGKKCFPPPQSIPG